MTPEHPDRQSETGIDPGAQCEADRRLDYQVSIGQMIFRSLILVNCGALLVLLLIVGFSGQAAAFQPRRLWLAFGFFAFGLFATIASGVTAFLAERCYYDAALIPPHAARDPQARAAGTLGDTLLVAASVCVILGALSFLTGATLAMLAMMPRFV